MVKFFKLIILTDELITAVCSIFPTSFEGKQDERWLHVFLAGKYGIFQALAVAVCWKDSTTAKFLVYRLEHVCSKAKFRKRLWFSEKSQQAPFAMGYFNYGV